MEGASDVHTHADLGKAAKNMSGQRRDRALGNESAIIG